MVENVHVHRMYRHDIHCSKKRREQNKINIPFFVLHGEFGVLRESHINSNKNNTKLIQSQLCSYHVCTAREYRLLCKRVREYTKI